MLKLGMTNSEKVYKLLTQIPKGKVLTYGLVAQITGIKSPRVVGNILHNNPNPVEVPCHRVVDRNGRLAPNFGFGGSKMQRDLLIAEGVKFKDDNVDLDECLWNR